MWAALKRLLVVIPLIFLLGITYTLICFSCAGLVELQLVMWGCNKTMSLGISIGVAIGIYVFIAQNHRLRDIINNWRQE